jgi:hypothetical protein
MRHYTKSQTIPDVQLFRFNASVQNPNPNPENSVAVAGKQERTRRGRFQVTASPLHLVFFGRKPLHFGMPRT